MSVTRSHQMQCVSLRCCATFNVDAFTLDALRCVVLRATRHHIVMVIVNERRLLIESGLVLRVSRATDARK